jgi:glycosyltransferase involved in cell wall biosynthesis
VLYETAEQNQTLVARDVITGPPSGMDRGNRCMRVLLACAAFPPYGRGGGAVGAALIAKALATQPAEVRVLVVGDQENREQRGEIEVVTTASLNVYRDWLRKDKPILKKVAWHLLENFNPIAYRRMKQEIRSYRPDVLMTVSTENINVASWLAAKSLGIPCVHLAQSYFLMCWHGSLFRDGANCLRCRSCRLLSVGKKYLSRYVDALITETDFLRRTHQNAGYFPKAEAYVIPGALDSLIPRRRARRGGLRVGFLGVHTREKGIETLAAAARRLAARSDIQFLVAGSGDLSYTDELKAQFPSSNTIFCGWVRPEEFYPKIDVVVVPSVWREPFGRVSIEGAGYGVPAIVTRSGGLPENVEHGHDGFVFEPGDDQRLAELLESFADDPDMYGRVSEGARERAKLYAVDKIGQRLFSCLTEVLGQKRGHALDDMAPCRHGRASINGRHRCPREEATRVGAI